MPAARREARVPNKLSHPVRVAREIRGVAPSDRPRRPRAPGLCQPDQGVPTRLCQDTPKGPPGFGVHLYCLTAERSMAGLCHYSPRIPGGFTLPHRFDGTLGRGPRSEPRAPTQMVSGALGSLGGLPYR